MRSWKCSYVTYPADLYLVERLECWNWVARVLETIWRIISKTNRRLELDSIHLLKAGNHVSEWSPPAADEAGSYPPFCFCCWCVQKLLLLFRLLSSHTFLYVADNENEITRSSAATRNVILIHRLAVILIPKRKTAVANAIGQLGKMLIRWFSTKMNE